MVDDTTAHLQSEINRIAAKPNAEPVKVGVQFTSDNVNIFIDDDGRYHYSCWERGSQNYDVGDIDDVLYRFAKGITHSIGSSYCARHRPKTRTCAASCGPNNTSCSPILTRARPRAPYAKPRKNYEPWATTKTSNCYRTSPNATAHRTQTPK
jgi:hypothetical protein